MNRVGKNFVHLSEKILLLFTTIVPKFRKILAALLQQYFLSTENLYCQCRFWFILDYWEKT